MSSIINGIIALAHITYCNLGYFAIMSVPSDFSNYSFEELSLAVVIL